MEGKKLMKQDVTILRVGYESLKQAEQYV